jgi:hypothetical protein
MAEKKIDMEVVELADEYVIEAAKEYPGTPSHITISLALLLACKEVVNLRSAQIASPVEPEPSATESSPGPTTDASAEDVGRVVCPGCERHTRLHPNEKFRIYCVCRYTEDA